MILIIIFNENDYQYQYVAPIATKKCVGLKVMYMLSCIVIL